MKCIIPCAGESSRMAYMPKHLVRIGDKPLILHIVEAWKDYVDSFVFIVNKSSTYLWEYLPENAIVVFQEGPLGLANAILQAEKCVEDRFIINLGDCLINGKFDMENGETNLGIGVWKTTDLVELNKSYIVSVQQDLVAQVVEKPNISTTDLATTFYCGMGVYFFDVRLFDYIRKAHLTPGGGDFTEVIQQMIDAGERISPIWFTGDYLNVGSPEDLKRAEDMLK